MPAVPDFSSLIVSRPSSGPLAIGRLRGLVLAGSLYASGLAALLLAPFLVLEAMNPPRAAINPEEPPIRLDIRQPRGGPPVRQGVRDGHRESRRSGASRPTPARAVSLPPDPSLP